MKTRLLACTCWLLFAAASAQIIPTNRLVNWTPGVAVGVPGGIPANRTSLIDVTQSPYFADNTGVANTTSAIQSAINAATSNQVVYLPAGTYRLNGSLIIDHTRNNITIRGTGTNTVIMAYLLSGLYPFNIGSTSDLDWSSPAMISSGNQVVAGLTKGSTNITITDTTSGDFFIGQLVQLSMANDTNIPVINDNGYDLLPGNHPCYRQKTRIVATNIVGSSNTLTVWPPLYKDYSAVATMVFGAGQQLNYFGLEDMLINSTNVIRDTDSISFEQCYGCWAKNVTVEYSSAYHLSFTDSLQCEARHCWLHVLNHGGSNGSGLIMGTCSGCLIEDNIIDEAFPAVEINNGCCGNVFAYNFVLNTNGYFAVDSNHGPHNFMNLYEGNIISIYECDGYFGSDSHDTIYRNWVTGLYSSQPGASNNIYEAIKLKRFTYYNSLVGNIIGVSSNNASWSMSNPYTVEIGYPDIGGGEANNGQFAPPWTDGVTNGAGTLSESSGTVTVTSPMFNNAEIYNPDAALYWGLLINDDKLEWIQSVTSSTQVQILSGYNHDWPPGTSYKLVPYVGGYQAIDTNVAFTLIRVGNFTYASNAIPAAETLGTNVLTNSYVHASKPDWFFGLAWPPFDPTSPSASLNGVNTSTNYNGAYSLIPAGYRFVNNGVDPVSSPATPTNLVIFR